MPLFLPEDTRHLLKPSKQDRQKHQRAEQREYRKGGAMI
jgi:hypothetical protein